MTQTLQITADGKVVILRKLDQLGINKSTVYPSLESSASYLANSLELNDEEIAELL